MSAIPFYSRFGSGLIKAIIGGIFLASLLIIGKPEPAFAVGNLSLGPIELHPYLRISEAFDDNVCRTKNERCPGPEDGSDIITIIKPGIQMTLPLRTHRLEVGYQGEFGRYNDFKSENYSDTTATADLMLKSAGGHWFNLTEEWKDGHQSRGFAQNIELDFYRRNKAGAELGVKLSPKFKVAVNYTNRVLNYRDDSRNGFRDRTDDTIAGSIYFKFLPKTFALLEYSNTMVEFERNNPFVVPVGKLDSTAQRGYLGLTWNVTPRTYGTIKGGMVRKEFDNVDADFSGGIMAVVIGHELTKRTSVRLNGLRDVIESNVVNQAYYTSAGAGLDIDHKIYSKVTGRLMGKYIRDKYPGLTTVGTATKRREDKTRQAGLGFDYQIQEWLGFGFAYNRTDRTSAFDVFEYTDNLYTFTAGLVL